MKVVRAFIRVATPLVIIAAGIGVMSYLVKTKPQPQKRKLEDRGVVVEVTSVARESKTVRVEAQGTVVPARQVVLSSEVMGRVRWMAPELTPGARVKANQALLKVDGRDYQLAVEQQYASLDRAQTELEIEKSRKKIAEREWELFGGTNKAVEPTASEPEAAPEVLALREPQMRTAKVAVQAASSGLRRAQLNVSKTTLNAPFNAIVQNRNVEVGQIVSPTSPVATLVGTDAYWVQVSIPVDSLSWIKIPGIAGSEGSVATVSQTVGGKKLMRKGQVIRLLGDVDPVGRMARVLVEIKNPLGDASSADEGAGLPLLIGTFVKVAIEGLEVVDVAVLPRSALHDGSRVFILADDMTLDIREVEVVWRGEDVVYVSSGISTGEKLIVSPLPGPVRGMKLRTKSPEKAATPAGATATEKIVPTAAAGSAP